MKRLPSVPAAPLLCRREADVLAAARGADLGGELAAHASGCRACTAALAADALLRPLARTAGSEARLPDPTLLLRRAREARLAGATRRALRPLRAARIGATAAGAATAVALLPLLRDEVATGLDAIGRALAPLGNAPVPVREATLAQLATPWGLVLLGTALLTALVTALMLAGENA